MPVVAIGEVSSSPVLEDSAAGSPICIFFLKQENTFIRVAVWGEVAFTCRLALKKSFRLYIEGTLEIYQGQRTILAANMKILNQPGQLCLT
jgi:single-stranded DNA-binding protein